MSLLLGPVLRHVGVTTAQVWVQTSSPATVAVLGATASTFEVSGQHYALVSVTGLTPGSSTPYTVEIDGEPVWPPTVTPFPPSMIRTRGPATDGRNRILFGSCRYPKVTEPHLASRLGIDALDAYAARMARRPPAEWPDALLLLGDQIYADELTPRTRRRIAGRRDRHPEWPDDEIVGFDEYVGVYCDAWSDPEVRWLMSTVPVAMIFDDHDVRDDWNTSAAWRAEMQEKPWWRDRIRSALASYWVYQHIGNLSPAELANDPDARKVMEHEGDAWPVLVDLADRADAEAAGREGVRFSFRWDLGHSRLLMMDSRNGRVLANGRHLMLGDAEFAWLEEQAAAPGQVDHLLLGTSVPWLLPHAIGELETVNEIAAAKPGRRGRLAEWLRQAADLEHWSAFRTSFDRLAALIGRAAQSGPGNRQRPVRRRPPQLRRARLRSRPGEGAPAHVLARAQRHGLVRQARLPRGLVPRSARADEPLGPPRRRPADSRDVGAARGAAVRQHPRHLGDRRSRREGAVRAACDVGHTGRSRPSGADLMNDALGPIAGQTVVLRPTTAAHVPTFLEILDHPDIAKWWGGYDLERVRRELLGPHGYAIELAGEVVGLIIYREEHDPDHRHAAMDLAVHPDQHGQGLGCDAMRAMARYLFEHRGHHRVVIDPAAHNTLAIRSCERAGFKRVGVMRRYERSADGLWHDALLMDLLADELR